MLKLASYREVRGYRADGRGASIGIDQPAESGAGSQPPAYSHILSGSFKVTSNSSSSCTEKVPSSNIKTRAFIIMKTRTIARVAMLFSTFQCS